MKYIALAGLVNAFAGALSDEVAPSQESKFTVDAKVFRTLIGSEFDSVENIVIAGTPCDQRVKLCR